MKIVVGGARGTATSRSASTTAATPGARSSHRRQRRHLGPPRPASPSPSPTPAPTSPATSPLDLHPGPPRQHRPQHRPRCGARLCPTSRGRLDPGHRGRRRRHQGHQTGSPRPLRPSSLPGRRAFATGADGACRIDETPCAVRGVQLRHARVVGCAGDARDAVAGQQRADPGTASRYRVAGPRDEGRLPQHQQRRCAAGTLPASSRSTATSGSPRARGPCASPCRGLDSAQASSSPDPHLRRARQRPARRSSGAAVIDRACTITGPLFLPYLGEDVGVNANGAIEKGRRGHRDCGDAPAARRPGQELDAPQRSRLADQPHAEPPDHETLKVKVGPRQRQGSWIRGRDRFLQPQPAAA